MAATGRECGSCGLCCKLIPIEALAKPAGVWCVHAVRGGGCGAYDIRPAPCRRFECHWLQAGGLGEEWRPSRAKFFIYFELEGARMTVEVDPGSPLAWRREPYYSQIKRWAAEGIREKRQVLVSAGTHAWVIFPEADLDAGRVVAGDVIESGYRASASGAREPYVTVTRP